MPNANYDTLLSTTLANHRRKLTDNIFKDRVLSWWLLDKKRTRMVSGGHKIVEPLLYAGGQAGSYSGWDQIAIAPQTGITAAEYNWKQLYATVAINGLEEAQNNGDEEVINLLETKVMQAEETLKESVNAMLWSDGTGNSGKDWSGVKAAITNANTVYGNINPATDTWWKPFYVDISGDLGVTAKTVTLEKLFSAINKSSNGNDKVDGLFTNVDIYTEVEGLFQPAVQYQDVKAANAGFENLTVKGIPLFFDQIAPAEQIYGLNSKYLTVVGHKNVWFQNGKFMDGTASAHATSGAANTVDGKYSIIRAYGNLTCRNRKRQMLMDWIDVTGTS